MTDLARIREDIQGTSEDARFLAFMALYESPSEDCKTEIERILEWRDPILKLKFLRFLIHVPETRAATYICWLLEDENTVVAEAAQRSFERNNCEGKLGLLLPLIHSPHIGVQHYAIDRLGQAGWGGALDPLLTILAAATRETPSVLLLTVVSALRFIPHPKSVDVLLRWTSDPREELRFRVTMALGTIYEIGVGRLRIVLHGMLKDDSHRVRQAAVWGLRRRLSRRDLAGFFALSKSDPDSRVRREAILGLGTFPTSRVIQHLLGIFDQEKDRLVMLQCEAVLLKMDHDHLMKGLHHIMTHKTGPARHRAMLMAAEFQQGSRRFYRFLIKGMTRARSDKDRLSYIEALGVLGNPAAVIALLPYLSAPPLVAYVAMAALLKVGPDDAVLLDYLSNPAGGHLLKQMILRYMVRKETVPALYRDRLVKCLEEFLHGDNINMRYLAAQMLIRVAGPLARDELLVAIQREEDPASRKLLRDSLVGFFTAEPASYASTLLKHRHDPGSFQALCDLLKDLIWNSADVARLLPHLLSPEWVAGDRVYTSCCVDWISDQVIHGRTTLDQVLQAMAHSGSPDEILSRLVRRLDEFQDLHLPVATALLSRRTMSGTATERDAMIDLMGISRSPTAIPVLVSVICDDQLDGFHDRAVSALSKITRAEVA